MQTLETKHEETVIAGFALVLVAPSAFIGRCAGQLVELLHHQRQSRQGRGSWRACGRGRALRGAGEGRWRGQPRVARLFQHDGADGKPGVNAKDRIGTGPWFNAKGVQVASSVADLHSDNNKLSKENSLTEKGEVNNGRGDTPNRHDILTGSNLDGTAADRDVQQLDQRRTGRRWRPGRPPRSPGRRTESNVVEFRARDSRVLIEELRKVGGEGFFYCFAAK